MSLSPLWSTRPCITICLATPDSGGSFSYSTSTLQTKLARTDVPVADASTPLIIRESPAAAPPGFTTSWASDSASAAIARVAGSERHRRRCASSAARSTWAPSSFRSAPCGMGRRHAGPVSSPNALASISGPSLAGRSSGENSFHKHTSGRSKAPASGQLSRSSACPIHSWTPSSAAIAAARVGRSCSDFSRRSRLLGPFKSRSYYMSP